MQDRKRMKIMPSPSGTRVLFEGVVNYRHFVPTALEIGWVRSRTTPMALWESGFRTAPT